MRYLGPHDFGDNLRRKRRRTASLRPGYPDQRSAHDLASTLVGLLLQPNLGGLTAILRVPGLRDSQLARRHCAASGSYVVSSPGARPRCERSSLGARRGSRTTGDAKTGVSTGGTEAIKLIIENSAGWAMDSKIDHYPLRYLCRASGACRGDSRTLGCDHLQQYVELQPLICSALLYGPDPVVGGLCMHILWLSLE